MWRYIVNDVQLGPVGEDELEQLLRSRSVPPDTLVWTEGMDAWVPAKETMLYSRLFSAHVPPPLPTIQPPPLPPHAEAGPRIVATMSGAVDLLEVYEDKVAITPKGAMGFLNKGLKGTKSIPYFSIAAIQFKRCGITSGYIQFTIPGGSESKKGVFAAVQDENSFVFKGGEAGNAQAERIKNYIEGQISKIRNPQQIKAAGGAGSRVADELVKLADLRTKGLLSDAEFAAAKAKLIGI